MDAEKITNKLMQIDEFLDLLNQIGSTKEDQFVDDKILIGSAKYYLQVSIEACLDVANHIIASEMLKKACLSRKYLPCLDAFLRAPHEKRPCRISKRLLRST